LAELSGGGDSCAAPLKLTVSKKRHVKAVIKIKEAHESRTLGLIRI
jgi:hypothetical protein